MQSLSQIIEVNTITLLDNLGVSYQVLGDYKNLLPVLQKRVAINKRISGLAHSKTFDAILNLAATLEGMGKYDEALLELKFIDDIPENNDLIDIKIAKYCRCFLKEVSITKWRYLCSESNIKPSNGSGRKAY